MRLEIYRLHNGAGKIHAPKHEGDAGLDIEVPASFFNKKIYAGFHLDIPLGLALVPEDGYYVRFEPRSSRFREGLIIHGIIDGGFRGELTLVVWNISAVDYIIKRNDRLGQALFTLAHIPQISYHDGYPTDENSTRKGDGFGSTDKAK